MYTSNRPLLAVPQVLATFKGSTLEGCTYTHPLYGRESPVVIGGDYITTESGTGLVHTAPGHGQEDYQVGWGQRAQGLCSREVGTIKLHPILLNSCRRLSPSLVLCPC